MALEQQDLRQMLETAIVAARHGGQHALEEINYVKVYKKNEDELVTNSDKRCQKIIIDLIRQSYPDHGIIAEESESGNIFKQPPRSDEDIWWTIDPIDGTNNYAHGILMFTVSIAVICEGEPVVGVIFDPATESMFTAVKGDEAQLNNRRISVGDEELSSVGCVGLSGTYKDGVPKWASEIMQKTKFRNLGTIALQLAYVARGGLIGTIAEYVKLWDIAAGVLICESAGAKVTNWQGNSIFPIDMQGYKAEKMPILAANEKSHAKLLETLKKE